MHALHQQASLDGEMHIIEYWCRGARTDTKMELDPYKPVTWQTVLFWCVQSHLMPGFKSGSLSMSVPFMAAAPVQGSSPLMFHAGVAVCRSLANTAFNALAANGTSKACIRDHITNRCIAKKKANYL